MLHKQTQSSHGNPRYAVHFLNLLTDNESNDNDLSIGQKYSLALERSRSIGGKKYNNKKFGGGIIFETYNPTKLENDIKRLTA